MKSNKIISILLGVAVIGFALVLAFIQPKGGQMKTNGVQANKIENTPSTTPPSSSQFTLAQILTHKDASSCWSTINEGVYDLTDWIAQHPGGEGAILSICGKDGSEAFNNQHGGKQKQADILATFKIGILAH